MSLAKRICDLEVTLTWRERQLEKASRKYYRLDGKRKWLLKEITTLKAMIKEGEK